MKKELRVLMIEDNAPDVVLINHQLRKAGLHIRSRRVDTRDAFLHELEHHPPDVILSDHGIPGFDGFAALVEARSRCPDVPFIFVTGAPGEQVADETLRSGADDYVLKTRLHLLAPAIEHALEEARTRARHRHLQMALANAEEHLRLLIEEVKGYATFLIDNEGRVASWNAGAQQLLGYEPDTILGKHFETIFRPRPDNPITPAQMLQLTADGGRFEGSSVCVRAGGQEFGAGVIILPLRSPGGNRGFACILHDRARVESAVSPPSREISAALEAENQELEELTYAIALDLRTPLRNVESLTGMLLRSASDSADPKSRAYLHSIGESTHQMSRLIDDLFTYARIGQTDLHRLHLSLADILREVIHDLRHETEGREIEWHISHLPEVVGDPVMLWIVMTNLISNAIKFTRPRASARIEVGSEPRPGELVVFVRDNGVGFDMHYAPRLFRVFQRFHKDEFAGTGVGLANVRRIIQRHGGRVWAEGADDVGATFYFALPHPS